MQDLLNKPAQPLAIEKILEQYVFSQVGKKQEGEKNITEKVNDFALEDKTDLPLIDWEASLKMMGGNKKILKDMLSVMNEDLQKTEAVIASGYHAQDVEAMRAELHRTLGGVCYLRLPQLNHSLRSFQTAIKRIPQNLEEVKLTYDNLKAAISAFHKYCQNDLDL